MRKNEGRKEWAKRNIDEREKRREGGRKERETKAKEREGLKESCRRVEN